LIRFLLPLLFFGLLSPFVNAQEIIRIDELKNDPLAVESDTLTKAFFSFGVGYGYRTARFSHALNSDGRNFAEKARDGFTIRGNYAYYLSKNFGVSLKYSYFKSEHSDNLTSVTTAYYFIGPGASARIQTSNNIFFSTDVHLGYIGFNSDESYRGFKYKFTGSTLGFDSSVSLDFHFSPYLSFQIRSGYTLGILLKVKDENGATITLNEAESLNRIDLTAGLKFYL
tara:strand:+ start:19872 stop:20549 length:678 start_codon:yes stop_codon:yes gene_type:complete